MAAVSVSTKQMEQTTRDAVCMILTQHVKARLAQTRRQLARGTPEAIAKKIVARWSAPSVLAFYLLAREERFVSHGVLAAKCGGTRTAMKEWWRRMQGTDIHVAARDGVTQPGRIDLFKWGRECFYAGDGVKLQLNTEKLSFPLARHVTESTLGHARAARLNYAGACDAQEADGTKSEEERTEARRRMLKDGAREDVSEAPKAALGEGA